LSRKLFAVLLIASILGLIIVLTSKVVPEIMVPFSADKTPSTSTVSPLAVSREVSPNNMTRPISNVSDVQPIPLETEGTQDQLSAGEEVHIEDFVRIPVNFSTYENSSYGLQMLYPSDWKIVDGRDDNDGIIEMSGFVSPFEDRFDRYKERVWLYLDNAPNENMTLEEYTNEVISHYNESLQDFHLLDNDTDSMILAGYTAYRLVYTSTLEDGTINKQMEIGTKIGDKVYYLTYYAEEEKYHNFLPVIHDMINSFEIG
jgi:hypothetical protein